MTKRYLDGRYEHGQVITGGVGPSNLFPIIVLGEYEPPRGPKQLIVQTEEALPAREDEPEEWGAGPGEAWVIDPSYVYADSYPPPTGG